MEPQEINLGYTLQRKRFLREDGGLQLFFQRPQDDVPSLTNHGTFEGVA